MSEETDICMVFAGPDAYHSFDYTPEALEAEAARLREQDQAVARTVCSDSVVAMEAERAVLAERVSTLEGALRKVDAFAAEGMVKPDHRLAACVGITFEARTALAGLGADPATQETADRA